MKKNHSTLILILVFFTGLSVLLYPSVSDAWNSRAQSHAIHDYETSLHSLDEDRYTAIWQAADDYNLHLRHVEYPLMNYDQVPGYSDILDVTGTGIMGYISIPQIGVELPVYHGTSEGVLNVAVGHVEGTSLPTGGPGTHTVFSAHRGLPSARLFTDLDKLEPGDLFTITVLDRILTYEVDQILIVLPNQVDELAVKAGQDLCTLVTCTPYGINTHRILVRGHRVETPEDLTHVRVTADAVQIEPIAVAPLVAAPMLLVLLIALLFNHRKKN